MNRLIAFFTKQGVFADLLTVAVIALGIFSAGQIRREVFPNVQFDIITVATIFPGASPEEVEKLVTNKIEQELKEVDGIKRMTSVSTESRSQIVVELDPDETTQEDGKTDIQDVIDRITDLPEDAEEPIVEAVESTLQPIIEVALYGEVGEMEMRETARRVEKELEEIDLVGRVVVPNQRDVEYRVDVDPLKLHAMRISLQEVIAALQSQNVSVPGGTIKVVGGGTEGIEKIVRTVGEFETAEEIGATVVRGNELGGAIRVRDVAKVTLSLAKATILDRTNGHPSLRLTVLKKAKADAIDLVDQVKARVEALRPTLGKGIGVEYVNDVSFFVRRRLSILTGNLLMGLVLVLIVLSLILPFRVAFMVSLGIPFAFMGTLAVFDLQDLTVNLISLIGLIIVVGMLVDDAIVVTDNSVRLMEEGLPPEEAAVKGAQQVWPAVFASVATTMVAFAPMLFMTGIFGKFIREMPMAVIIALGISLVEAFLVLPYHISRWVRAEKRSGRKARTFLGRILAFTEHTWDQKIVPFYARILEKVVRYRYRTALGAFALFVVTLWFAGTQMKLILFPGEGIDIFLVRVDAPVGTRLEKTRELVKPLEQAIAALPKSELMNFTADIGVQRQDLFDPNTQRGGEYAILKVYLTPERERERTAAEIMDALKAKLGPMPELARVSFERVNPGPPVGKPINVGVQGETYEEILPVVQELKARLAKVEGVSDLRDSYVFGKKEVRVEVKPAEAAAAGLTVASVGQTIRAAYEGIVATSIAKLDESVDVRVQLPETVQTNPDTLGDLLIPNPRGNLVPLERVARFKEVDAIANYQHEDNKRQIRVTGEVNTDIITSQQVNELIRKEMLPGFRKAHPGITYVFGGEDKDTAESMASLARAFVVAAIGIFLILVFTFKQLLQPLLVLLTIPLGIIAVIFTLFVHGQPLSFLAILGIIALGGVIVNNAIVYVDFVNQQRAEGVGRFESIIGAARMRLRPIFLTTATTVVGVLPTAYGIGGLDPFVVPIALALGWGLAVGSILTTFIFPAALAIIDDVYIRFGARVAKSATHDTKGTSPRGAPA